MRGPGEPDEVDTEDEHVEDPAHVLQQRVGREYESLRQDLHRQLDGHGRHEHVVGYLQL